MVTSAASRVSPAVTFARRRPANHAESFAVSRVVSPGVNPAASPEASIAAPRGIVVATEVVTEAAIAAATGAQRPAVTVPRRAARNAIGIEMD